MTRAFPVNRRAMSIVAILVCAGALGGGSALGQRTSELAKNASSLRAAFKEVTARASKSTVLLRTEEKGVERRVAMGTIVSADGFILTKASEVMGDGKIFASIPAGNTTRRFDAKIVGYSAQHDLAMLKIEAVGLTPVTFADTRPPPGTEAEGRGGGRRGRGMGRGFGRRGGAGGAGGALNLPVPATAPAPPEGAVSVEVGDWVASVNAGATLGNSTIAVPEEPFAVGVISLTRRYVPFRSGALGVQFAVDPATTQPGGGSGNRGFGGGPPRRAEPASTQPAEAGDGAKVVQVVPLSPAERIGVKIDDVITSVNGVRVRNGEELRAQVQQFRPGDVVTIVLKRGEETLTLRATLGSGVSDPTNPMARLTSGPVSARATDFPAVFQHDTVLSPADCGGPLVDLEGQVIGINIARAERTESYALPADLIVPLIEPMKSGKLAPVNANTPAPAATRPEGAMGPRGGGGGGGQGR